MNVFNDAVLKSMYVEYHIPCDRLVSDPDLLRDFSDDYSRRSGYRVEPAKLSHRLLNLRRRGEANGGLCRLQRGYYGRGN